MDLPIGFCTSRYPHKKPESLCQRYHFAVLDDDKDEFLRIIKEPEFKQNGVSKWDIGSIFSYDALQIGIAVFNDETKGIIDLEDVLVDGMTPLHYTALMNAPRLTKYLLERGDNADAKCDYGNLKQATPLDLAVETKAPYGEEKLGQSVSDLLFWLCYHHRNTMEVIRLLIQNTQNTERVKKASIDYAVKGQPVQFSLLFLAAPELILSPYFVSLGGGLSSFGMLYLVSNSMEKRTEIEEGLSLLLDVFAMVGDKLVAYVRLEETSERIFDQRLLEIDFFLREAARKKLGVCSPDYYFRFYKRLRPKPAELSYLDLPSHTWDEMILEEGVKERGPSVLISLPSTLMRKDVDRAYIYKLLPVLETEDAGRLNRAINKKLSSMSTLNFCRQDMTRISKMWDKIFTPIVSVPFYQKF